ncbi:hypothetical protein COU18_01385 [Candidatus Kaiserbacteria bacterium CG10_big_fil_rev_8_21_14_0_10_51_14]|uniref:DUF7282 domain-containing protein n=1 Tax=Candidatus Kaiserbacteria bacterium CG10_big_fil_rev_8_21_14_0_10_51_14 TaxID=1974610 RepID=A0A2H0UCB8_9BACT|nr:MAG: hypothetical protein COU18_01385 [Candidatus Kaiserbacteria bacterium CG10_big_fil_rev_8_21_14_0_10_51_14]
MNKVLVIGAIVLVAAGGYYLVSNTWSSPAETSNEDTSASGMRTEENMAVVLEQRPGTTITGSLIYLAAPGYLVIHEDTNGESGAILGSSAFLPAGESSNVPVTLSRATRDGEKLHAMLHFEKGGNTTFTVAEDSPVPSRLGGPISGWFEISSDASINTPVSI